MKRILLCMMITCMMLVTVQSIVFAEEVSDTQDVIQDTTVEEVKPSIEFNHHYVNVFLLDGYTETLNPIITGLDEEHCILEWSVEDPEIVRVEDGVIYPLAWGKTRVYVSCDELKAWIDVNVTEPYLRTTSKAGVYIGDTKQLKVTSYPTNRPLTYTSSDETIATVDETGMVMGLKEGVAKIEVASEGFKPVTVTVTVVDPVLAAPVAKVTYDGRGIIISWDEIEGADRYDLYRKKNNGSWKNFRGINSKNFTGYLIDGDITMGNQFSYKIKATGTESNLTMESDFSNVVTKKATKLLAPENFKAKSYNVSRISLTWDHAVFADKIEVYRSSTGKSGSFKKIDTISEWETSYKDESLKTGKKFYYKIRVVYDGKKGPFTAVKSAAANIWKPEVKKTVNSTLSTITIKWKKVSFADGYYVYRKTENGSWKKIGTVKGNKKFSYKDSPKAGVYQYSVKGYILVDGKKVFSPRSATIKARTLNKPTITVTHPENEFKNQISWKKITGATHYEVWKYTDYSGWCLLESVPSSQRSIVSDVSHGKVYQWKVRAVYEKDGYKTYGKYSNIVPYMVSYVPNFKMAVPEDTKKGMRYITVTIENLGETDMKIYKAGAIVNVNNSKQSRDTVLVNTETNKELKSVTIKKGKSKTIKFKVVGDTVKYTDECFVGITFHYDGVDYAAATSALYGSYFDVMTEE